MPGVTEQKNRTELHAQWSTRLDDHVIALRVAAEGTIEAVGLGGGELVTLDATTGHERARVRAHEHALFTLDAHGDRIVTGGQERQAKLWSTEGTLLRTLPVEARAVEHVAISPRGDVIAVAAGRTVRLWTRDGDPIAETEPLASTPTAMAFRFDGSALAIACYGGVHVIPTRAGGASRTLAWKGSLVSLAWSPDGKVIACGSQDCTVHFWRLSTGLDSEMQGYPFKPRALGWDSKAGLLATAGDAKVTLWDFTGRGPEGTRPIVLDAHRGQCTELRFAPRKGILASGAKDTSILLWEPRRAPKPTGFAFVEDEVTALEWMPRGDLLVAGDAAGTVRAFRTS